MRVPRDGLHKKSKNQGGHIDFPGFLLKEFTINFNHEVKAGEKVTLYRAFVEKEDGLHIYIEGRTEAASSFCVEIIF